MHNHAETKLKAGATFVTDHLEPAPIASRSVPVGSPDRTSSNTRLYFIRLARRTLLPVADGGGTPGAVNSTRIANIGPTFSGLAHSPAVPPAESTRHGQGDRFGPGRARRGNVVLFGERRRFCERSDDCTGRRRIHRHDSGAVRRCEGSILRRGNRCRRRHRSSLRRSDPPRVR